MKHCRILFVLLALALAACGPQRAIPRGEVRGRRVLLPSRPWRRLRRWIIRRRPASTGLSRGTT